MTGHGTAAATGKPRALLAGLRPDLASTVAQVAAALGFAVNGDGGPEIGREEAQALLQEGPAISLFVLGASPATRAESFPVRPTALIDAMATALARQAVDDAVAVLVHDQAARIASDAHGEQALYGRTLRAAIPVLALRHAPRLRVNAVVLGAMASGGPPPAAVARAVRLIAICRSMTGQVVNLTGESAVRN